MEDINAKESRKAMYISLAVLVVLVVGLITNGFGLFNGPTGDVVNTDVLEIGNSPVLGNPNAPITIYEFSDFSCPFCAAADGYNAQAIALLKAQDPNWEAPIPKVVEEYVETGKAKMVFKYYPGHGQGRAAHIVALALNEQDLFWEFHDAAFENQEQTGNLTAMKELARQLGADMTKLDQDISKNNYNAILAADTQMARDAGVQGTPTFIINGKTISGAQSYSEFKEILDSEL